MAKKIKKVGAKTRQVTRAKVVTKPKKDEVALLKQQMAKLKRESNAKIKALESQVKEINEELGKKEGKLQASKKLLVQREAELNRLKDETEYKNKQLASKDVEMETYKKTTEEKISRLEAKARELEGGTGEPSFTS